MRKLTQLICLICVISAVLSACHTAAEIETSSPVPPVSLEETVSAHTQESTSVTETEPVDPFAAYSFLWTDPRDRAWEEDLVYMTRQFLDKHRTLADKYYFQVRYYDSGSYLVNDNNFYDPELRREFTEAMTELTGQIPQLTDAEILYEAKRITALLHDAHSQIIYSGEYFFPVMIERLEQHGIQDYYVLRLPKEYDFLLYAKLVSINGIAIEKIIDLLRPYVQAENEYWQDFLIAEYGFSSLLADPEALAQVGVLEKDALSAEFTLETEDGTQHSISLSAIPSEAYSNDAMSRTDFGARKIYPRYDNTMNYWFESASEDDMLYVRISTCQEINDYTFDKFCWDITDTLHAAGRPLKLVIDLRGNTGGYFPMSGFLDFAERLQKIERKGLYILIDNGVFSSGIGIAGYLHHTNPDAVFLGSPSGQPLQMWGNPKYYDPPNKLFRFRITEQFWMFAEHIESDTIIPDIPIYQSLEDHKNGIDTVLEYVRNLES